MSKCKCGGQLAPKKRRCYKCEYREKGKERYTVKREVIVAYKSVPCHDCGNTFPYYIMDFDHVRGEKKFNISSRLMNRSLEHVLEEIAKCDVVCSNCHRERTHKRLHGKV